MVRPRTRDTVSSGMEHENGLAAYLTGEDVNASCIPAANELAPRMLRLNLLFQRGMGDGNIERDRARASGGEDGADAKPAPTYPCDPDPL